MPKSQDWPESQDRWKAALECSGLGVWDWDVPAGRIDYSDVWKALCGLGAHEDGPSPAEWDDWLHPDDRDGCRAALRACLDGSAPFYEREQRLRCRDGRHRWVLARGSVRERGPDGAPLRIVGTMLDIDEGKRAILQSQRKSARFQDNLHKVRLRSRTLFDRAPLGIALKDSITGRYLDVNPKFQEIVGRDRETLLGMRWQDITHPDDLPALEASTVILTEEAPSTQLEKRYIRGDGSAISVLMTITRFESFEEGNPRHLAMIEDVTEQRELQQRLLQRQRLEALGQLTGGIAHDFNNLLTVIIGNSEALAQALDEGDLAELAGLILTTGERAADLTGRLLTFARKQSLTPRSVKVGELVEGLLPLLRRAVPDGIQLKLSARFSSRSVYADPAQLEMALLNLVLNARDALPRGGTIEIASENLAVGPASAQHAELQPGRYVVLSLSDDGIGMSAETLEQAFDPFFTTKGAAHGSGLGLSMVYGFARQSGGHVELSSRPGEGTTVRLYLPATTKSPAQAPAGSEAADDRGAGETVLIAEDDAMVRKYVTSQVAALGYRTIATPDGRSALEVLRGDTPIDLLFTDIAMEGGVDGIELAGHARTIRPDLPVLFTSGHAEQHLERLAAIDARLLRKPYRRKDLADHLRLALSGG